MTTYIGRFAPSPTGPLHLGSLMAATASYLDAKANQGQWLVRMEDLDKPREMPGAADDILRTLEAYGFEWDGEVLYQSQRDDFYQSYLDSLIKSEQAYPCGCTRKEIETIAHAGIEGMVYPGTCRQGLDENKTARAWRVKVGHEKLNFTDTLQGQIEHNLAKDIGDFVLKRADGLFAYQLAVVVDDAKQGITDVVRGADLLNSTSRQIYLQQQLGMTTPKYTHIPVLVNADGQKLSKQTHAPAISSNNVLNELKLALHYLGLTPLTDIDSLTDLWLWASQNWSLKNIGTASIEVMKR